MLLISHLRLQVAYRYWAVAVLTLRREWFSIDKHRLDKFLMLARRLMRQMLLYLRTHKWCVRGWAGWAGRPPHGCSGQKFASPRNIAHMGRLARATLCLPTLHLCLYRRSDLLGRSIRPVHATI